MRTKTSVPRGNLIPIYDRFILLLHDSYFMPFSAHTFASWSITERSVQNYENICVCLERRRMEATTALNVLKWEIAFVMNVVANQFRFRLTIFCALWKFISLICLHQGLYRRDSWRQSHTIHWITNLREKKFFIFIIIVEALAGFMCTYGKLGILFETALLRFMRR